MSILTFSGVTFSYDSSDEPLIVGLTAAFPEGWTGVVGANGTGKSTLLRLAVGDLTPQSGTISTLSGAVYCRQRTDDPPEGLAAFLESGDLDADAIKSSLGVGEDWPVRWKSLSHGERKRAQVAVELWVRPAVLALDEPTNHIDSAARSMLERALDTYRGVGLLVSHDRALLDALCHQCLFLDPPEYVMRPGGYSRGAVQSERDAESRRKAKERLSREAAKLRRETARRGPRRPHRPTPGDRNAISTGRITTVARG
jgi:ATPase subunit of ABC transporter with duplicated ATPase domains